MSIVIDAVQVREGDKIRVTTQDGDRTNTATGVAHHLRKSPSGYHRWFTAEDWSLWTGTDGAVIELLDRPKPKIAVPSLPHAIVTYQHGWDGYEEKENRTAVRSGDGSWVSYDDNGRRMNGFVSDEYFSTRLSESEAMHDLKVVFGGVAK